MGVLVREKPAGSGIWWIFVNHQGKHKARKIGRDRNLAREIARKIEARLVLGGMGLPGMEAAPTFKSYAATWLTVNVAATCKPSTQKSYRELLHRHVQPVFGDEPVTTISRLKVKQFLLKKIGAGFAPSTVGHMRSVISGVLNLAVDDGIIMANPAHRLGKLFKQKPINQEVNPLTREELKDLLKTFETTFPRHYAMALTLARTGMRLGEVLALKWEDVDFRGRFIEVKRSLSLGRVETPKSGKSRRVDMSLQLAGVLEALRHQRKRETMQKGWKEVPSWVFVNEKGKALDHSHWRNRVFHKALEKAGLRKIRIHDLWHTFASLLIQAGEPLPYIRDQLGHHSIKITVDIYGHLAPGGNKAAVDRLDDPQFDASTCNLCATKSKKGVAIIG